MLKRNACKRNLWKSRKNAPIKEIRFSKQNDVRIISQNCIVSTIYRTLILSFWPKQ